MRIGQAARVLTCSALLVSLFLGVTVANAQNSTTDPDEDTAEIGARLKAHLPGVYDDLSNADVGVRIKEHYPGSEKDVLRQQAFRRLKIRHQLAVFRSRFPDFAKLPIESQIIVLDDDRFKPEGLACADATGQSSEALAAALAEHRKQVEQATDLPLLDETLEESMKRSARVGFARVQATHDDFELHIPTIRDLHQILGATRLRSGQQPDALYWELYGESLYLLARYLNEGGGEPPGGLMDLEVVPQ